MSTNNLNELHTLLCEELTDAVKNGQEIVTKDGIKIRTKASPALLNVIRQFLKDNNVEGAAEIKDSPLAGLLKNLPAYGDEDDAHLH